MQLGRINCAMTALLILCSACGNNSSGTSNNANFDQVVLTENAITTTQTGVEESIAADQNQSSVTVSELSYGPPLSEHAHTAEQAIIEQGNLVSQGTNSAAFPNRITALDFQDQSPHSPLPPIDQTRLNQQFGNFITRVSSNEKFTVGDNSNTHDYSKRQAWNANETLLIVGDKILSAKDYRVLREQVPLSTARNWSNLHPSILYGLKFTGNILNEFGYHDFNTDTFTLIRKFDRFNHCTLGEGEGNISNDDRYALFSCRKNDGPAILLSFDILNNAIIGEKTAEPDMNWAGFSQSGSYILVGNSGEQADKRNIIRYNPDLSNPYILSNKFHHGDLGLDTYGADVFAMIGATHISYIRLMDKFKVTFPVSTSENPTGFGHVTCRNIKRPGWCYFSTYNQFRLAALQLDYRGGAVAFSDQDGEFSVQGVSVVEPWGIHRSTAANYQKQPRVSASPSGRQIIFSSDWYGIIDADAFVIGLEKP